MKTTMTEIDSPLIPIHRLKSLTLRELMAMKFAPKEPLIAPWFYTCVFRRKSSTDSDRSHPPIPIEVIH